MWRVAGVVADVRQTELQSPAPLMVYLPPSHNRGMNVSFVLRTNLPADSVARSIRQAVWQVDPNVPVTAIRSMSQIVATSTAQRRFQILLLGSFAGVALLLAALGIYGTLSYAVNQRYREIGIRMALGAGTRDILPLVLGRALWLVAGGVAVGGLGALALSQVLAGLLTEVGRADLVTFAGAAALVVAAAALACLVPALVAARLDPVAALRRDG